MKRCGHNLWNLSRELEKLILHSDTGEILEKDIIHFTIPHPETIIWTFLEDLSGKKMHAALKNFKILLEMGESPHQILAMIFREVRIHAQIRSGIDQNFDAKKISSEAGLHPFVVQKTIPSTRKFSPEKIEKMYDKLFEIDRKIKTGGISVSTDDAGELEVAIEKFIITVCQN